MTQERRDQQGPPYLVPPRIPWVSAMIAIPVTGALLAIMIRLAEPDPLLLTQPGLLPIGSGLGDRPGATYGVYGGRREDQPDITPLLDPTRVFAAPSSDVVALRQDVDKPEQGIDTALAGAMADPNNRLSEDLRDQVRMPSWKDLTRPEAPRPKLAEAERARKAAEEQAAAAEDAALLDQANSARRGYVVARITVEIDATGVASAVKGELIDHTHGTDEKGQEALRKNIELIRQWQFEKARAGSDLGEKRTLSFVFIDADWSEVGTRRRTR